MNYEEERLELELQGLHREGMAERAFVAALENPDLKYQKALAIFAKWMRDYDLNRTGQLT